MGTTPGSRSEIHTSRASAIGLLHDRLATKTQKWFQPNPEPSKAAILRIFNCVDMAKKQYPKTTKIVGLARLMTCV